MHVPRAQNEEQSGTTEKIAGNGHLKGTLPTCSQDRGMHMALMPGLGGNCFFHHLNFEVRAKRQKVECFYQFEI